MKSDSPAKIRLLAAVLPTLTLEEGGRVGSLVVTQQALADAGALPEHTEGFVDLPRTIRGVEISILYAELPEGRFKLSLRSKGNVNVERVARAFGGGGHINAAGCRMEGELSDDPQTGHRGDPGGRVGMNGVIVIDKPSGRPPAMSWRRSGGRSGSGRRAIRGPSIRWRRASCPSASVRRRSWSSFWRSTARSTGRRCFWGFGRIPSIRREVS